MEHGTVYHTAVWSPVIIAAGEFIGLPGNILEKVDDVLMNNSSNESLIRAGVSLGVQQVFRKLGILGAEGIRKVSYGVNNELSEAIIINTAGEMGEIYDKGIKEKREKMSDNNLFRILFGFVFMIVSSLQLFFLLRRIRRSTCDSSWLSLSRLQYILVLIAGVVFGLFLIFLM